VSPEVGHVTDTRLQRLFSEAAANHWDRRTILKRAAAMGVAVPAFAAMFGGRAAFAQDGTPGATPGAADFDTSNPLGVDPAAPLNPYIFDGGFGVAYAENANSIYNQLYPESVVTFESGQGLGPALQPRFVGGNPPDVIDNSGADNLDQTSLAAEGQLADLADLMAATALDTPGSTFADTLIPNSQLSGIFNGQQNILFYAYTVIGAWASGRLMRENNITYPKTWEEMLTLSGQIKNDLGIAPWVTTGVHTQYMRGFVFDQLVFKNGGLEAMTAIDHLEEGAWLADPVRAAAAGIEALATNGYFLEGFEGLNHTQSQTEWLNGAGVFLPCGSWLENESGVSSLGSQEAVDAFEMTLYPIPSLTSADALPFEAIFASAGENFFVPSQAVNVQGGKEWLRILFSKAGARFFTENTRSLTAVVGAGDGLELGPALASMQSAIAAAGSNTLQSFYSGWYVDMNDETKSLMFNLMTGAMTADEFCEGAQAVADDIASDDSITKFRRPDAPAE
jgi:N-acetylglucosamine transport system substrate-binding protein